MIVIKNQGNKMPLSRVFVINFIFEPRVPRIKSVLCEIKSPVDATHGEFEGIKTIYFFFSFSLI